MKIISTSQITVEKAERALSVFQNRLQQLEAQSGISCDPYKGAWVGSVLSRTIEYCDDIIVTSIMPTRIKNEATGLKLKYKEQLERYNQLNPHFIFHAKSASVTV